MTATATTSPVVGAPARRTGRSSRPVAPPPEPEPVPAPIVAPPAEVDSLAAHWQWALDAAASAVDAGVFDLPAATIGAHKAALTLERRETSQLLRRFALTHGVEPAPWLSVTRVTPRMLGLPPTVRACIFDLEGVLTDSGQLHAAAWAEVFDAVLLRLSHEAGWQFIPFDREEDYRTYIDGRPRLEGIHGFLASRGIHLPEGSPGDGPQEETAYGLARRKGELIERLLRRRRLATLPGARRYLQAAGFARLSRAVISASTSVRPMLEIVSIAQLVDARIDADAIRRESLHSRPAPDLLLAACRRLGVEPAAAATLTHSGAGVVAGQRAGLTVIGVAAGQDAEILRDFGAERVVASLGDLLDPQLQSPRERR